MQDKIEANGMMLSGVSVALLTSIYLIWNSPLKAHVEASLA